MNTPRILIAGIGNIFLGDDAFGVEVAQQLARRTLPEGVQVLDFGIRGLDLAYALLDGPTATVLVDATPRGGKPGTLYLIEPQGGVEAQGEQPLETHGMTPTKVLQLVERLGGQPPRVLVVGCEPMPIDDEEEGQMGLSAPVQAAIGEAITMIEGLLTQLLAEEHAGNAQSLSSRSSLA